MTGDEFESALAKLNTANKGSKSVLGARMVLVDGLRNVDAAIQIGVSPACVSVAVKRIRGAAAPDTEYVRPEAPCHAGSARDFTKTADEALIRLPELIPPSGPIPFRRTTFLELVAKGEAPAPALKQPGCTAWRWGDIRAFLDRLAGRTGG